MTTLRAFHEKRIATPGVLVWFACLGGLTLGAAAFTVLFPVRAIASYDFQAFWCGGKVLLAHANPYFNQPLHACEVASSPEFFTHYPNLTIPDPLPAYAIALFSPLASLPFSIARVIWWILLMVCAYFSGRGIARITGMSLVTAYAASAVAILAPALILGSLAPLPIALTIWGAVTLRRKKWTAAAILLGFAMIEPHVVLPVCATAFIFVPLMRLRLLIAGLLAGAVMLLAVGPHVALSYFTVILPTHAASETNSIGQYSLSAILYHVGVPARVALEAGSVQYACFALCGLVIAGRLYRKSGELAWIVLVPAAFAVIGGAFIHLDEVAMAVPLACLVAMRRPGTAPTIALVLLALPFESLVNWAPWTIPAALAGGWLLLRAGAAPKVIVASGLLLLVAVGAIVLTPSLIVTSQPAAAHTVATVHPGPNGNASLAWASVNARYRISPLWWPEKLLTFVPLGMLVWFALVEAGLVPAAHRRRWVWTSCVL